MSEVTLQAGAGVRPFLDGDAEWTLRRGPGFEGSVDGQQSQSNQGTGEVAACGDKLTKDGATPGAAEQ